jgi:hypothetical protein
MENKNTIKVVNLSGGYIQPRVSENNLDKRVKWISYGIEGHDDFFTTLTMRYEGSQTNQACINSLADMIYGKGVKSRGDNDATSDYLYTLTTEAEMKKIILDFKLYGNAAIQITYSPDRTRIIGFYHLPVPTLRAERVEESGEITGYYYSPDWENKKIKPVRIPAFGCSQDEVEVAYIKSYSPMKFYYSTPDYYSCIQYCAVEEEISNLHLSNIRNGFLPTSIINFNNGMPPIEERAVIESAIKNSFTGTSNAGKFVLSFNENPEYATTVTPINIPNLHNQYELIAKEAEIAIIKAHRITSPLLLGIRDQSKGFSSNADELKTSYDLMYAWVINPTQQELLAVIEQLLNYNNVEADNLYFMPLIPFGFIAEITADAGASVAQQVISDTDLPDIENPAQDVAEDASEPERTNEEIGYTQPADTTTLSTQELLEMSSDLRHLNYV